MIACAISDPIISAITVADFKTHFFRDFNYIPYPTWINTAVYNVDDIVLYAIDYKIYKCLDSSVTSTPETVVDWEEQTNISAFSYTLDQDITKAFDEASVNFAYALPDCSKLQAFLYLAAHFLVLDTNSALSKGRPNQTVSSRSVSSVSESYIAPQNNSSNKFSYYETTSYGQKYIDIIKLLTIASMFTFKTKTNP